MSILHRGRTAASMSTSALPHALAHALRSGGALCLSLFLAGCADDDDDATTAADTATDSASASDAPTTDATTDGSATIDPSAESSGTQPGSESGETSSEGEFETSPEDESGSESGDESSSDSGESSGAASLEISGMWVDDFGGGHVITDTSWATSYGEDVYPYTITAYDNPGRFAIAQSDDDDTWSKFEWTFVVDALYFCQSAFGEASAQDAANATDADPTDPAASGCGGFGWSLLTAG